MKRLIVLLSAILSFGALLAAVYFKFFSVGLSNPWLPTTAEKAPQQLDSLEFLDSSGVGNEAPYQDYLSVRKLGDFVHHYSKRQAWNTEESMILASDGKVWFAEPEGEKYVSNDSMTSEMVWSNTNPNHIFGIQSVDGIVNRFVKWNVATNEIDELYHFSNMTELTIGQWEGTVSNDDNFIVLYGLEDGAGTIISFSISELKILGTMRAETNFNWAGVSQYGQWVLVENNKYPDPNAQLVRYKIDLTDETVLLGKPNHGDFCIDAEGDEVYAMAGRQLSWVKLKNGEQFIHKLPPTVYGHLSCRSLDRPGWAYLSIDSPEGAIGAIPLVADFEEWEPWGRHYSSTESYKSQPKASVSRTGYAVIFSSDLKRDKVSSFEYRINPKGIPKLKFGMSAK